MKIKLSLILLSTLFNTGVVRAVDAENRASNIEQYGNWFLVELTMPNSINYRIGAESKLPQDKETMFIDISPLNKCEPDKITVNKFIGYQQMDFSNIPFLPVSYKISGKDQKDSVTTPVAEDGFLYTPIEKMKVEELLAVKDKGNFSFWITPPADSKESLHKMFFPLNGFSNAYNKAIQKCKESM